MISLATAIIFVTTVALAGATEACIDGVSAAVKKGAAKVWSVVHHPKASAKHADLYVVPDKK